MRCKGGVLVKVRRPGAALALWVWALSLLVPAWPQRAEANLDPLRIVTSQIVRPNILVVLDTSGSMVWRPDSSTNVGGDCYNGDQCVATAQSNTCTDGQACLPSNTCTDGSACSTGVNGYCTDGKACQVASFCGSGSSQTLCPSASNTCRDGSSCQQKCSVSNTFCSSASDCAAQSCNLSTYTASSATTKSCSNTGATCSVDTDCGGNCYGTCSGGTKAGKTCLGNGDCPSGSCKTNGGNRHCAASGPGTTPGALTCSASGSTCGTCDSSTSTNSHCTKPPYQACVVGDSTCNGGGNSCSSVTFTAGACSVSGATCASAATCAANTCAGAQVCNPATTTSSVCSTWCGDGTQCSAPTSYCAGAGGTRTACAQECSDGSSCSGSVHCATSGATCGTNVYKGSSRLAIAKHVIANVLDASSNLVNFGFMTYKQTGYFPYVKSATQTTSTQTACYDQGDLQDRGAWSSSAPAASFVRQGTTYTLVATGGSGNSQYRTGQGNNKQNANHDYCGTQCQFSGHTWSFRQACYTYTQVTNTGSFTTSTQATYQGDAISLGSPASTYNYYPFSPTNNGPISGEGSSGSSCDDSGNADGLLKVGLTMSDVSSTRTQVVTDIRAWLQQMGKGGLVASGGTPIGCTLQYNFSSGGVAPASVGIDNDAYSYLKSVKDSDTLKSCRQNFVILVTDGEPNGPKDDTSSCSAAACQGPDYSSCQCSSVLAAKHLYDDLGVKSYFVGFGSETVGSQSLENMARAGGSCRVDGCAYHAGDENALNTALQGAIFDAVKGDYATSAPTVATSSGSAYAGDVALLASTEFPSWKGHVRATDVVHLDANGNPTLLWDAGNLLQTRDWSTRNLYTSDPTNNNALVPLLSGGVPNKAALFALGLGASAAEADDITRWILGQNRDWKLGALFNVTGVTVSNTINLPFPGHSAFANAHSTRAKMVYVGADDGLLHAFFFETGPNSEPAGSEAWAYLPPAIIPALTALYARGGQNADPATHIYGLASSPKVNDVCTAPCTAQSDWKTVLVSGAGPGSTSYFSLDITDPSQNPPFSVLWRTANLSNFNGKVGQSWSVPAFSFVGTGASFQSGLIFGSGYDTTSADGLDQGNYTFIVNPVTGANISAPFHYTAPSGTITTFAALPDLAVANDPSTFKAIAAYQAELGGRIWRFANGTSAPASALYDAGAGHPFYYSPAVSALNATDVVVAAVDKTFDDLDVNPASGSVPTPNLYVMTDRSGTASAATALPFTSICKSACHAGSCAGCPTFDTLARPVASPVLLTNLDATATSRLQVLLEIYQPVPNSCSLGSTSLVVVDVDTTSTTPILKMSESKAVPGAGRSAGIFIGAGGVLVSGSSGTGNNASSVSVVAGAPAVINSSSGGNIAGARLLGISETDR